MHAIKPSQNTAPVAEFRCLFTHDIRRKQKRWQDGYLKFHSFNNRVMVYDTARNFLGDTYWKDSNELQEGDELTLDKGIMVDVADALGVTQTDLTPLFEKKTRESPRSNLAPKPLSRPAAPLSIAPRAGSQLRHKSLNTVLGTPKGPIGKAVPLRSPYEARKEKEKEWGEERAAKRQKMVHDPVNLTSSSPVRAGNSTTTKDLPLWTRTSDARKVAAPPRPVPREAAVINLDSDIDYISSGITLPSTPPGTDRPRPQPNATSVPASKPDVSREAPVQITPKLPRRKVPLPQSKAKKTPGPPPQSSSPPVSASNRLSNVDFAIQPAKKPTKELSPPASPPRDPRAKALRLSTGNNKRRMLLCQAMPQQRVRTPIEPPRALPPKRKKKEVLDTSRFEPGDDELLVQSKSTEYDRAREKRKAHSVTKETVLTKPMNTVPSPQSSPDAFDDMEIIHGLMDQQLMVPPAPKTTKSKPTAAKKAPGKQKTTPPHVNSPPLAAVSKITESKSAATGKAPERQPVRTIPPPAAAAVVTHPPAKELFPEPQRNTSASTSPRRAALSTGGFRKKPKSKPAQDQDRNPALPISRPITVALPPHPLRANKSGPLMSTTELSALLQKPQKPRKLEDDPIEDASQQPHNAISPNRAFRRVRSENDAPILSTSEEWEKRNLPVPGLASANGNDKVVAPSKSNPAKVRGLAALVKKTDPRRKFQRTQSLNVGTAGGGIGIGIGAGAESLSPPPVDTDIGPWSTEAFDLFDWRPPVKNGEDVDMGIGMLVDKQ